MTINDYFFRIFLRVYKSNYVHIPSSNLVNPVINKLIVLVEINPNTKPMLHDKKDCFVMIDFVHLLRDYIEERTMVNDIDREM